MPGYAWELSSSDASARCTVPGGFGVWFLRRFRSRQSVQISRPPATSHSVEETARHQSGVGPTHRWYAEPNAQGTTLARANRTASAASRITASTTRPRHHGHPRLRVPLPASACSWSTCPPPGGPGRL